MRRSNHRRRKTEARVALDLAGGVPPVAKEEAVPDHASEGVLHASEDGVRPEGEAAPADAAAVVAAADRTGGAVAQEDGAAAREDGGAGRGGAARLGGVAEADAVAQDAVRRLVADRLWVTGSIEEKAMAKMVKMVKMVKKAKVKEAAKMVAKVAPWKCAAILEEATAREAIDAAFPMENLRMVAVLVASRPPHPPSKLTLGNYAETSDEATAHVAISAAFPIGKMVAARVIPRARAKVTRMKMASGQGIGSAPSAA